MNIFIGNLNEKIQDQHLETTFRDYGVLLHAKVIKDKYKGLSREIGFIEMPNDRQTLNTNKTLNGGTSEGKVIKVSKAFKKQIARQIKTYIHTIHWKNLRNMI